MQVFILSLKSATSGREQLLNHGSAIPSDCAAPPERARWLSGGRADRCCSRCAGTAFLPKGNGQVSIQHSVLPVRHDILAVAREQVVERGERLTEAQML